MSEQALEKLRAREEVARIVEREASRILGVLEALYRDPELSGQEVRSARLLMDVLAAEDRAGFRPRSPLVVGPGRACNDRTLEPAPEPLQGQALEPAPAQDLVEPGPEPSRAREARPPP